MITSSEYFGQDTKYNFLKIASNPDLVYQQLQNAFQVNSFYQITQDNCDEYDVYVIQQIEEHIWNNYQVFENSIFIHVWNTPHQAGGGFYEVMSFYQDSEWLHYAYLINRR